jgi:nicotinamidase-related amidase
MPLTNLDEVCALVVIDLQKGVLGFPTVHPVGEIVDRSAQLARAFRQRGLPVVLVNVSGMAPGRTDAGMPKYSFTDLHDQMRSRGVTQILLTGVATSAGVESTARSAYDLGYNVALITDAMTDRDAETHRNCIEKLFPRIGETATTAEVLALLQQP